MRRFTVRETMLIGASVAMTWVHGSVELLASCFMAVIGTYTFVQVVEFFLAMTRDEAIEQAAPLLGG